MRLFFLDTAKYVVASENTNLQAIEREDMKLLLEIIHQMPSTIPHDQTLGAHLRKFIRTIDDQVSQK